MISDAIQKATPSVKAAGRTDGSPNLKTFSVATDILTFAVEREKGRPKVEFLPRKSEGRENHDVRSSTEIKTYRAYEENTVRLFQQRYWPTTLQHLIEIKLKGMNIESVYYQPTSYEQIRDFAIGLANVAEKMPVR